MLRGLSFVRHKFYIVLESLLVLFITAGLSGCGPTTYETTVPIVICTPNSPMTNVYRATPQPGTNAIFESAFPTYVPTPVPPNPMQFDEPKILSARYAAFQRLINETKRWSDTKTIKLDDSSEVSVTLTFLSPELLQAVFLNEVLKNRYPTYGFQDQLQKTLNAIALREELLFLVTVTTTNNSANPTRHTIKIPMESMVLHNAENLTITHTHDDYNLEQVMDTLSEPAFGYLAYPFAQVSASGCKWILDPKYNTNIVIAVPYVEVDEVNNKTPISWMIPYAPLINPIMPTSTPAWNLPPGVDPNSYPMTPLASPPIGVNQTNNWQDFARFVWNQITLGNY
jgi:hypothetical protein